PNPMPAGAYRDAGGNLIVNPSFEAATDGDDYIEGGGGNDVIFGDLGQDDIIGGSSDLFSLSTADKRPDGSNLILGGAGSHIARAVRLLDYTPGGPDLTSAVETNPANIAINPITGVRDIGGPDEIHGEAGDDFVYGGPGNDKLFGDGQNDIIVGGYGADWISGG